MAKLTPVRREILAFLGARNEERDGCLSKREISNAMGHVAYDWSFAKIDALHRLGLVEKAGSTFSNARTWRITEAGRAALASATEKEGA